MFKAFETLDINCEKIEYRYQMIEARQIELLLDGNASVREKIANRCIDIIASGSRGSVK